MYFELSSTFKGTSIPGTARYQLNSCTFTSNSAKFGGAAYISNPDYVQIQASTFSTNSAKAVSSVGGNGGGVYYSSSGMNFSRI